MKIFSTVFFFTSLMHSHTPFPFCSNISREHLSFREKHVLCMNGLFGNHISSGNRFLKVGFYEVAEQQQQHDPGCCSSQTNPLLGDLYIRFPNMKHKTPERGSCVLHFCFVLFSGVFFLSLLPLPH